MDYSRFSVADFVTDGYFIRSMKHPTEESEAFWKSWIINHPHQESIINEAKQIILFLQIKEETPPQGKYLEIWDKIVKEKSGLMIPLKNYEKPKRKNQFINNFLKIAASIAILACSIWAYTYYPSFEPIVYETSYGGSRTLFLPDSTKLTLNANSSLTYYERDFKNRNRRVVLNGEAYFAVSRKSENDNFLVDTKELQVEVLGTHFNVNSRRGKTKVVLEEGKVKLNLPKIDSSLVMQPGDYFEISENLQVIERKIVKPTEFSSWRSHRLEFNATSLEEIAYVLEDNYGYAVIFNDPDLKTRKFTGTASTDDLSDILHKLEKVFDLKIKVEGNKIIIKNRIQL